jgi:hypothetical protein
MLISGYIEKQKYTHVVEHAFSTNFKNTSTREFEHIIKCLKAKESYGYDGITTKI